MVMKEALGESNVINYEKLDNVNDTYSNFIQKIMISIHILPSIIHIIKVLFQGATLTNQRNSLEWFDSEIPEKLIRDKLFKNTAKNLDFQTKRLIKQQKLIAKKKKEFFENKLREFIGKPKDLWKALKSLGLPNKSGWGIVGVFVENEVVKHDTKPILKTFKNFYSDQAGNLLAKLPMPPYAIDIVADY